MKDNREKDIGRQISDTVRDALNSGDFSRLKDIGPIVSNTVANAVSGGSAPTGQPPPPPAEAKPAAPPPMQNQAAWMGQGGKPALRQPGPSKSAGLPALVLGSIGALAFGVCALVFGGLALGGILTSAFGSLAIGLGLAAALSAGAIGAGNSKRRLAGRLRQYYTLLAGKKVRTFDSLALETGLKAADIKKDIKKGIAKGMAPDLRVDAMETCVMQGEDAFRLYLDSEENRKKREEEQAERDRRLADPNLAPIERFRQEGQNILAQIRAANDAIPGQEISAKLNRLEATTGKIFAYVEKYPQKLPDVRRFMDYYLPTTLKLVDKYRQYDEMEIQPPSILHAKQEIENALDTIDEAYNNLLDSLFHDDTLDVTTDIEVLQQVLQQEGLTGGRFELKDVTDLSESDLTAAE